MTPKTVCDLGAYAGACVSIGTVSSWVSIVAGVLSIVWLVWRMADRVRFGASGGAQ